MAYDCISVLHRMTYKCIANVRLDKLDVLLLSLVYNHDKCFAKLAMLNVIPSSMAYKGTVEATHLRQFDVIPRCENTLGR